MDDLYCALCGVCFDVYTDLYQGRVPPEETSWTAFFQYFRRADLTDTSSWYLSQTGQIDGSLGWEHAVDHDNVSFFSKKDVVPYTSQNKKAEVVYPMHPACWRIFCQQYALAATQSPSIPDLNLLGAVFASQIVEEEGRGFQPDWTIDFEGPENFWNDGWAWTEDAETSEVRQLLDVNTNLDFLVFDPYRISLPDDMIRNPPVLSGKSSTVIAMPNDTKGILSRLPIEILQMILGFLPTLDVRNIRLASRLMAFTPLTNTFWRTRFEYPNELSNFAILERVTGGESNPIDWRNLREGLLNFLSHGNKNWQNRQRISTLTGKLVRRSLQKVAHTTDSPAQALRKSPICRQSFPCSSQQLISQEMVYFDLPALHVGPRTLSLTFQSRKINPTIVGISFSGSTGSTVIGKCSEYNSSHCTIAAYEYIAGFVVGIAAEGLVGIKIIFGSRDSQAPFREEEYGSFGETVALGRLLSQSDSIITGLQVGLTKNGRIASFGVLEEPRAPDSILRETKIPLPQKLLWHPSPPPLKIDSTNAVGVDVGKQFSYMRPILFTHDLQALKHVWSVNCFVSPRLLGIDGFQVNFEDRQSVPDRPPLQGRDVPFLIDGPDRERLSGMDVLWSRKTGHVGVILWTNRGRSGVFANADISGDVEIQRLQPSSDQCISGLFGEITPTAMTAEAYRKIGLLLVTDPQSSNEDSRLKVSDTRSFDDNMNVWTEGKGPPIDYVPGQTIGHPSSCGFVNYIDFARPIQRVTACLGSHKYRAGDGASQIVGLKFDMKDRSSTLLGRCTKMGSVIQLKDDDVIKEVEIGCRKDGKANVLHEIIFHSHLGISKGFREGDILIDCRSDDCTRLVSSEGKSLVGMTWAFDFGFSPTGDHGLQPLFQINPASSANITLNDLFTTLPWLEALPAGLRLRPAPRPEDIRTPLASSLHQSDNLEMLTDTEIASIAVFFNAFIQGIKICYRNGQIRAIGNLLGATDTVHLEHEQIFAVAFRERRQQIIRSQIVQGDLLCIEGIQFGLLKTNTDKPEVRYSQWIGSPEPFGPFIRNQRGLWHPLSGGSADWIGCFPAYTNTIYLQPGTSFAGFFSETTTTHVRRLGILVGACKPLSGDLLPLKSPSSFPRQAFNEPSSQPNNDSPWLGTPPPSLHELSDFIGRTKGKYRMWCPLPEYIDKIVLHRHKSWDTLYIIGLEFFGSDNDTLLGFRSLWMEHAIVVDFADGEKILGIAATRRQGHQGTAHLGDLQVTTTSRTVDASGGKDIVSADSPADILGFYCYINEYVEGIGMLLRDTA